MTGGGGDGVQAGGEVGDLLPELLRGVLARDEVGDHLLELPHGVQAGGEVGDLFPELPRGVQAGGEVGDLLPEGTAAVLKLASASVATGSLTWRAARAQGATATNSARRAA